jgi:hypothetical protein
MNSKFACGCGRCSRDARAVHPSNPDPAQIEKVAAWKERIRAAGLRLEQGPRKPETEFIPIREP